MAATPDSTPHHVRANRATWAGRVARLARIGRRPADLRLLLAAIPLLSTLPLLCVAAVLLDVLADAHLSERRADLVRAARVASMTIERDLDSTSRRLATLADRVVATLDEPAAFVRVAQRELTHGDDLARVALIAADGRVIADATRADGFAGAGAETPAASVGAPSIQVPVRLDVAGSPRLVGWLAPSALSRTLARLVEPGEGGAMLVDAEGRVIAGHRDISTGSGRPVPVGLVDPLRAAASGSITPIDMPDGPAAIAAWARLPSSGWTVVLWRDPPRPLPLAHPMHLIVAVGLCLLAAASLLALAIATRISSVLGDAGRAAQAVASARRPRLGRPAVRQFDTLFDALNEAGERVVDALDRERDARAAAEDADRRKDRFLLMLGHELRNPLNAVGNAGHLLRRRDLSDGQRDGVLDMLLRQSRQLGRLVDDLLDLGRVLAGKFTLQRETVDVDRLLRQSIATLAATGQLGSRTVRADLDPIRASIDPVRFEQVFANLLGNAIKYTDAGGSIAVRLVAHPRTIELAVSDDGIGIEPAMLDRVFDLFVQADPPLGQAAAGLGIGLSMARLLVEAHDGTIAAHSEGRGRGTTMVVHVPRTPHAE